MTTHLERQAVQAGGTAESTHILVTVNQAWNIWNFRRAVIQALLEDGHRVTVLAPPDATVPNLERMGCAFIPLAMDSKGLNPLRDLALLRRMRAMFSAHRPDVILSYTIKNNIYGALAARSLRIPFLPNVSGLGTAFLSQGLLRRVAEGLYRAAFASVPAVFFQNGEDRALFIERRLVREDQARLLPGSGIDLERFAPADYPLADAPPVFLLIARLLRDKGVHEFVEAAGLVKQIHPGARFQLLGAVDAQNRTAIDRVTVTAWEQSGAVEYLGTCDDVREHIAPANCVVLPSYREGAPRTLIEAAAMARPLIATDVPGCRSVVEDGVNGFLCEVRSGKSLAQACLRFLALPREQQAALGRAGRTKMEREFGEARVIAAYRQPIAESLGRTRSQLKGAFA
ncbi:glycosyltransferase [Altererythrobacter confluentis]|uniref:Glycosyltransferase n=2 Tax=Allopontixanthobacter confluentis TaxID=1849021 RepID=A0A6L7GCU1_9SPHN|nr:glycosyltransferase [Allopontixanthobacter confluentis]